MEVIQNNNLRQRVRLNKEIKENNETQENKASQKRMNNCNENETKKRFWCREDLWLWVAGLGFMATLSGLVMIMGEARGWDAQSGYSHNISKTSAARFLPEPYQEEIGVRGRYGPDAASRWYYWKLKTNMITFWTRLFPWAGYVSHQLLIWAVIYTTQSKKDKQLSSEDKFTTRISFFNAISLVLNMIFHLLHLLNTHITYDALAQDVSIASSQSSVVVILILIILMEYNNRGLLFGWPTTKHTSRISRFFMLSPDPSKLIRKYHGYAFAWAAVFTFWYHPMENTWGHLSGAFYTWVVLLQGSLIYTKWHLNEYWRQFLEAWVIFHGFVVASQTGGPEMLGTRLWPMFTFGFAMAWVVTQVFGLSLWDSIPRPAKLIPLAILMSIVIWAYSWIPDRKGRTWVRMGEILRLPLTYYLYFVISWASGKFLLGMQPVFTKVIHSMGAGIPAHVKKWKVILLAGFVTVYLIHTILGIMVEYGDLKMRLTPISLIFDAIFIFGSIVSFIFLDEARKL